MTQKRDLNDPVGAPVDSTAENSGDGGENRGDHAPLLRSGAGGSRGAAF